ncbi:MAG: hypothetical protein KF861_14765 [Planctomycetaceae bacterium]|nr:hypothetical protein [Planctomycetaceae bacterium]
MVLTDSYADNMRYAPLYGAWGPTTYGVLIGTGTLASIVCLGVSLRGWWHLAAAPFYLFLFGELLVLTFWIVRLMGTSEP